MICGNPIYTHDFRYVFISITVWTIPIFSYACVDRLQLITTTLGYSSSKRGPSCYLPLVHLAPRETIMHHHKPARCHFKSSYTACINHKQLFFENIFLFEGSILFHRPRPLSHRYTGYMCSQNLQFQF
jgi:hypothetical protein